MKHPNQENKKSKLPLIIGILVVCLAVAGFGAWFFFAPQTEENSTVEAKNGTAEIKTPYGKLILEGDWVSALRYNVIQGDVTELNFAAQIAGADVKLFDLYLGSEENLAGFLTADSGEKVPVEIVVYDIVPAEGWTQEEEELAFSMQDTLNEILTQLGMESVYHNSKESEDSAAEVSLETSFGVFTYLDAWNSRLRIADEDGCISGFGTVPGKLEQKLFEISFGGEGDIPAGMYTDKNGQDIPVFLTVPDLAFDTEWTEQERRDIYGMQNVLNDILEQLNLTNEQQMVEVEDVTVVTSYGVLVYPGQFDGKLRIDQDENNGYRLSAFAVMEGKSEIHLFDLLVGIAGDVYAGTLSGQDVYINVPDLVLDDTWTETEFAEIYGMQALLNDFTGQLSVEKPEEEEMPAETESVGDIVIQTTYGNMKYPGEYRQNLVVDRNFNNGYEVKFYAKMESGEKIPLFDVIIGGEGDSHIGRITAENGNSGELYITSYEFEPDNSWSEEEIQMIFAMQESVNYILEDMVARGILTL